MKRRPVYLRDDQWDLVVAVLSEVAFQVSEHARVSLTACDDRAVRATVRWSSVRLKEIADVISPRSPS